MDQAGKAGATDAELVTLTSAFVQTDGQAVGVLENYKELVPNLVAAKRANWEISHNFAPTSALGAGSIVAAAAASPDAFTNPFAYANSLSQAATTANNYINNTPEGRDLANSKAGQVVGQAYTQASGYIDNLQNSDVYNSVVNGASNTAASITGWAQGLGGFQANSVAGIVEKPANAIDIGEPARAAAGPGAAGPGAASSTAAPAAGSDAPAASETAE